MISAQIALFIKKRRKELNISQKKLADQAGIREQTYIEIEKGGNHELKTLISILDCLKGVIEIKWFDDKI